MLKKSSTVSSIRGIGKLLSKKWRVKLLCTLRDSGPYRFSELKHELDISSKVLTNCITELEEYDIIERNAQNKSHVSYSLTEAGESLLLLADELDDWLIQYHQQAAPTVLIVDDEPRVNNLFAERLAPNYEVEQVSEPRQLDGRQFDEADIVVFHYKPFGAIDSSSLEAVMTPHNESGLIVITPTRYRLDDLGLPYSAFLTLPVLKEELEMCIETVLDCRAVGD